MINKKPGVPSISADRINNDPVCISAPTRMDDKIAHAFVKGKEAKRALCVYLPISLYDSLSKVAFKRKSKMNRIINELVTQYVQENKNILG